MRNGGEADGWAASAIAPASPAARAQTRSVRRARSQRWRRVVFTTAGTLALAALLSPNVYGILQGYRIESLKLDQARLVAERASLEVEEARLMSPERLQELAPNLEFLDPGPGQVVYLNPKPDGSLAWNQKSK